MPFSILQTKRGERTRIEKINAKVRKGQARNQAARVRTAQVDNLHSAKIDKSMSNKAQKLAKRALKRAGLLYWFRKANARPLVAKLRATIKTAYK